MLKIANTCLSRSWGGLEMAALAWTQNLGARGHETHVIVPEGSRLSQEARSRGLSQITVPLRTKYLDLGASLKIRSFLKRRAVQIVHSHTSKDLWVLYPSLVGRCTPKFFYTSRMLFRHTPKKDMLHSLIYARLDGVIALSEVGRQCLLDGTKVHPEKVRVIPDGFDPVAYRQPNETRSRVREALGVASDEVAVGCTSRIDRGKGQLELIEAFRHASRRFSNLKLVIAGEPTFFEGTGYLDFIRRKVAEYGLNEKVVFTGYRNDIPEILSALDIFVLPTYEETFGNALVEAMLAGCACIATDAGGPPEILDGGKLGLLVEPRSVDSLARAIEMLAGSPDLRHDLGARARRSASERFALERVMKQVEEFYASV